MSRFPGLLVLAALCSLQLGCRDKAPKKVEPVSEPVAATKSEPSPALPSLKSVSAESFSNESVNSIRAALDCKKAELHGYCEALERFAEAVPLSLDAEGVWPGAGIMILAQDHQQHAVGEGIYQLQLEQGRGALMPVHPSSPAEATELQTALDGLHAGKAPDADSSLGQWLSTARASESTPLQTKGKSLSFAVPFDASAMGEELAPDAFERRAFLRHNKREILLVEVVGNGHVVGVGVFPKS